MSRKIVYLDPNKWIALAKAAKNPNQKGEARSALEFLVEQRKAGRILLPLTATNVYETSKINNPERRFDLAYCMTTLGGAHVFRGRHRRLEVEIVDTVRRAYGMPPLKRDDEWFLSQVFYEATAEWDDARFGSIVSEKLHNFAKANPQEFLFRFLMETPEEIRTEAVRRFSQGVDGVRQGVEDRRVRDAGEKETLRRNFQNAMLMMNEIDEIRTWVTKAEVPGVSVSDILQKQARRIMNETPTYFIERELALRLEGQHNRPIQENDFRDMQSFCAVIAYSDIVIAENQFTSLARQAGLNSKYGATLTTSFAKMMEVLATLD
ncbi:hypothetical protein ABIC08_006387 [Bradyrhizobium sp. RT9b]|uniref:hypothetical protein n=1 Tax=Bradyrhizobium sp. RT9b TaxID=3156385 RepID=UPI00339380B7